MPVSGLFTLRYPPPIPCIALLLGLCLAHISMRNSLMGGTLLINAGILLALDLLIPSSYPRKHLDLPSSQATPINTCPGLRPRWCPVCSPYRSQDCCLPYRMTPSAFTSGCPQAYHNDHNYTFFGAQYTACILDSSGFGLPSPGLPADFTTDLVVSL